MTTQNQLDWATSVTNACTNLQLVGAELRVYYSPSQQVADAVARLKSILYALGYTKLALYVLLLLAYRVRFSCTYVHPSLRPPRVARTVETPLVKEAPLPVRAVPPPPVCCLREIMRQTLPFSHPLREVVIAYADALQCCDEAQSIISLRAPPADKSWFRRHWFGKPKKAVLARVSDDDAIHIDISTSNNTDSDEDSDSKDAGWPFTTSSSSSDTPSFSLATSSLSLTAAATPAPLPIQPAAAPVPRTPDQIAQHAVGELTTLPQQMTQEQRMAVLTKLFQVAALYSSSSASPASAST